MTRAEVALGIWRLTLGVANWYLLEEAGKVVGDEATAVLPGHGEPWLDTPAEAVRLARLAGVS